MVDFIHSSVLLSPQGHSREGRVSAGASTLTATGAFTGEDFSPPALNFRYDNPTLQGSEYIVTITSGTGYRQTRRIASNDDDSLTVEYPWNVTPAGGDTFRVSEIVAMPEAINPSEGYMANWNNKAATAHQIEADTTERAHEAEIGQALQAAQDQWREAQEQVAEQQRQMADQIDAQQKALAQRQAEIAEAEAQHREQEAGVVFTESDGQVLRCGTEHQVGIGQ